MMDYEGWLDNYYQSEMSEAGDYTFLHPDKHRVLFDAHWQDTYDFIDSLLTTED